VSGDGNDGERRCWSIGEHCATTMHKAAVKNVQRITSMCFLVGENLDAEVPRLVLLLVIDSIGILGEIAWVASR